MFGGFPFGGAAFAGLMSAGAAHAQGLVTITAAAPTITVTATG